MRRTAAVAVILTLAGIVAAPASAQIAVRARTVHTMAGPAIKDGVVLIRDGKIERVGPASDVQVPAGYRVIEARVATPGLIDGHSTIGVSGYLNQPHDQDQLERSAALQPELRAIDAYNDRDRLVEWVRGFGITTIHTGHGPGALVSGQTMVVKTDTAPGRESVLKPAAMIAATLGEQARASDGKSPGTRAKMIAMLRSELIQAQEYVRKQQKGGDNGEPPARNLKHEAFAKVLAREWPLLVTVHRAHDILSALRLAQEFNISLVLDGVAEAYLVTNEIKASGFPVIIHPTMARSVGDAENLSMETAATLKKAGIPVVLQSGYESYVPKSRVVLYEAALAAANGLTFDEALGTITIEAARLLGIADRVGSLEAGKDADLALFDGDPFEYTTHCTGVIINGRLVSEQAR